MTERPILFSGPMVRAILDGSKTQTRRLITPGGPKRGPIQFLGGKGDEADLAQWGWWGEDRDGNGGYTVLARGYPRPGWTDSYSLPCPHGDIGDRLWVRETWAPADWLADGTTPDPAQTIAYRADLSAVVFGKDLIARPADTYAWNWDILKWRPSIYMPRWASRIDLEITGVRVERLQDITEEDARAEGFPLPGLVPTRMVIDGKDQGVGRAMFFEPRGAFCAYWSGLNGPDSWKANPWVWVVSFKQVRP